MIKSTDHSKSKQAAVLFLCLTGRRNEFYVWTLFASYEWTICSLEGLYYFKVIRGIISAVSDDNTNQEISISQYLRILIPTNVTIFAFCYEWDPQPAPYSRGAQWFNHTLQSYAPSQCHMRVRWPPCASPHRICSPNVRAQMVASHERAVGFSH